MIVEEILQNGTVTTEPEVSVREAAELMAEKTTKFLIVTEKGKLVGIVTEWDFVKKLVAKGKDIEKTKISEIMTKSVIVIPPETEISDAAEIMAKNNIKKLPVVSKNVLIGVVTAIDILAAEPKIMERISELFLTAKKNKPVAG